MGFPIVLLAQLMGNVLEFNAFGFTSIAPTLKKRVRLFVDQGGSAKGFYFLPNGFKISDLTRHSASAHTQFYHRFHVVWITKYRY